MKPLLLIRHPELFQGEKQLLQDHAYFEGYYFKNSNAHESIAFIVGINIGKTNKAFIQIITDQNSYFIDQDINNFQFHYEPFHIQIGNCIFSKQGIEIDIKDESQNLEVYGFIKYTHLKNIKTSVFSPNIMGPFSYLSFMECNHAILSMQSRADGTIHINHDKIIFDHDKSYIEKDWGCSFPKSYIWCQANQFSKSNASFMLSMADIPMKLFTFKGLICVLMIDDQEYRFTTYNLTKVILAELNKNSIRITLKKYPYLLEIEAQYLKGSVLSAPVRGKMVKEIVESTSAVVKVILTKKDQILFSDFSLHGGLEIVQE